MQTTDFELPLDQRLTDPMRLPCITAGLIPVYLATSVLAGVKEIWWNITYVEGANPDGLFKRRVIGVNNTWPYVIPPCYPRKFHPYVVI
jgi:hypothetical protein